VRRLPGLQEEGEGRKTKRSGTVSLVLARAMPGRQKIPRAQWECSWPPLGASPFLFRPQEQQQGGRQSKELINEESEAHIGRRRSRGLRKTRPTARLASVRNSTAVAPRSVPTSNSGTGGRRVENAQEGGPEMKGKREAAEGETGGRRRRMDGDDRRWPRRRKQTEAVQRSGSRSAKQRKKEKLQWVLFF